MDRSENALHSTEVTADSQNGWAAAGASRASSLQRMKKHHDGGVARAFDLAGITNTVGAPFLRVLCEEPALSGAEGAGVGNAGARHQAI